MRRAIELARRGEGLVEPNPMVGAVLVDPQLRLIGEGWHERFGEPHAEVNAIRSAKDTHADLTTSSLFVTLEPCQHTGKTPPCTDAVLQTGIPRVVIGAADPARHTASLGIKKLRDAVVDVQVGLLQGECQDLIAPFNKRMSKKLPWVIAKWAMTLDGRIASKTGHSQWISSPESREIVHSLRGRMDAIIVGKGTALADDPQLTARPPGSRTAMRVVIDRAASLPIGSKLATTARETPTIVYCGNNAPAANMDSLRNHGVDVVTIDCADLANVLRDLYERGCTNVLIEGGGTLLGSFFDQHHVDEVHVFIGPKVVGGQNAISPVGGAGLENIPDVSTLRDVVVQHVGSDAYMRGRLPSGP